MKTYFLARFDLTLSILNDSVCLKNGEIAFLDEQYCNEIVVKSNDKNFDSYTFNLDECLNSECDFIGIKNLNNESLLVELKPKHNFLPRNIRKQIIGYEDQMFLIEIYNNNLIKIYTNDCSYTLTKKGFIDFSFDIKTCYKKLLFLCFNFKSSSYYFIFNNTKLIYEGLLKEFNIKDNHLILLNDDISCYGQKRVVNIDIKDNKEESYFVYGDDRELFDKIDKVYLFLDALKIKNYEICKQYLSNELCEIEKDCLFEFFEDFDEYKFIENSCLLEKNNEVTKIVHFEVLNNKIVNIFD